MIAMKYLTLLLFLIANTANAQTETSLSSPAEETSVTKKDCKFVSFVKKLQNHLDSSAVRAVDTQYIEVPKLPWRIIARQTFRGCDILSDNLNQLTKDASLEVRMRFNPGLSFSTGFWVGYRGLGIGFSQKLLKNGITNFGLSGAGARYGFNFQITSLTTDVVNMTLIGREPGNDTTMFYKMKMLSPVNIATLQASGYYVFNGRRYSQAAAYSQSVIQRRSAGSFLVGAEWIAQNISYEEKENAGIIALIGGLGRIRLQQVSVSAGYGYNWVPARGWVINAMVMPTLSVFSQVKSYTYDSNYKFIVIDNNLPLDGYGKWNSETQTWENGETHKPISQDDMFAWIADVDMWRTDVKKTTSYLRPDIYARFGSAYCWKRYFLNIDARINCFYYGAGNNYVRQVGWSARASFGVRL